MFFRAPAKKSKMYLGSCQLSLMELLLPKYLTDFSRSLFPQKSSLIDVWQEAEHASTCSSTP